MTMTELTKLCEEQANRLRNERIWIEATCMLFKVSENQLFQQLNTFFLHCISGGEDINIKSIKDIKHHFRSYLYGNIQKAAVGYFNPEQQREADFCEYFGGQLASTDCTW